MNLHYHMKFSGFIYILNCICFGYAQYLGVNEFVNECSSTNELSSAAIPFNMCLNTNSLPSWSIPIPVGSSDRNYPYAFMSRASLTTEFYYDDDDFTFDIYYYFDDRCSNITANYSTQLYASSCYQIDSLNSSIYSQFYFFDEEEPNGNKIYYTDKATSNRFFQMKFYVIFLALIFIVLASVVFTLYCCYRRYYSRRYIEIKDIEESS